MIFDYSNTTILGPHRTVGQIRRDWFLPVLTFLASAFWWCPICATPSLDLPPWIPAALVFLWSGLATILSDGRCVRIALACTLGSTAGMIAGFTIFPTEDIAGTYEPLLTAVAIPVMFVTALIPGLIARMVPVERKNLRCVLWILLYCLSALGPITQVLTPPLIAERIKRNDQAAEARFIALKRAVEASSLETGSADRICDGALLKRHYSGPAFSESDWQYIAGNHVQQGDYFFGVWCHQQGGYTIDASPKDQVGYGSRHFCTDESGKIGCGLEWRNPRETCIPCAK